MKKKITLFDIINVIVLSLIAFVCLYPFYYVVAASISDPVKLTGYAGMLWKPLGFSLDAYVRVFKNPSIFTGYMNTLFYVFAGSFVNIVMTCMGAYILTRKEFMLRRLLALMFIFTMYFGGGMIPNYLLIKDLHLINNRLALILPGAISTFNMMIMMKGFEGIPDSLEESARIDGAGDWTIMTRIIMPLAKPTIMVIFLYYAVGHWNSWFNAMIYLKESSKMPLQIFLREILTRSQLGEMAGGTNIEDIGLTIKYATIVVSTAPILCIYPFVQKHFVKGVLVGSVKE